MTNKVQFKTDLITAILDHEIQPYLRLQDLNKYYIHPYMFYVIYQVIDNPVKASPQIILGPSLKVMQEQFFRSFLKKLKQAMIS